MKNGIAIFFVLTCISLIFGIGEFAKDWDLNISENRYISYQIKYQILFFALSLFVLAFVWFQQKDNFIEHFRIGNLNAEADELKIFGIKKGDKWIKTGLSLLFVISIVTAGFIFFSMRGIQKDWNQLLQFLLPVILISLFNSFGEEIIFRLALVSPLKGNMNAIWIYMISAILFGLPHYFGNPGGIAGVLMASIMGYVLAKSVYETNGIFWTWLIHFVQDIIIISALVLTNTNQIK